MIQMLFIQARLPIQSHKKTSIKEKLVGDIIRCVIDTPGIDDSNNQDDQHLKEINSALSNYPNGISAFLLVINVFDHRVDGSLQKTIKILHNFFNNPQTWERVCIVFTHCFDSVPIDKDQKRIEYRSKIIELISKCTGKANPQVTLPAFFVDSLSNLSKYEIEIENIFKFSSHFKPLPTNKFSIPSSVYYKKETKLEYGVNVPEKRRIIPIIKEKRYGTKIGPFRGESYHIDFVAGYTIKTQKIDRKQEILILYDDTRFPQEWKTFDTHNYEEQHDFKDWKSMNDWAKFLDTLY